MQAYQSGFNRLKNLKQQLGTLKMQADEARSRQDYNQFLYNELEEAKLSPTEQSDLELTLERLNHAETIKRSLLNAIGLLTEDSHAAHPLIREAAQQLQTIVQFDPFITELYERLRSVMIEVKDISDASLSIEEKTIHDAEQLTLIQTRLDLLYTLQQKHRVNDNAALILLQDQLGAQLHQLFIFDEQILILQKEITQLNTQLLIQAEQLSQNRKKAIKLVEKEVLLTLKQVGMPNANLLFNHQLSTEISAKGLDQIQLLFSANAGQAPAPVNKVASGGELSRLMLAIKTLLAQHATLATIIFDEIDSGISGETALKVAKVLSDLGQNMQVISITHLPQIAAKGHAHYFVFKTEEKSQTTTGIRRLNDEERIIAIAEMLSGRNPGKSALMNAKELLR
ncbi:DNA repair protein RecN [compost metagenome]